MALHVADPRHPRHLHGSCPSLFALYFSFTDWNGISPPRDANWVGLANFQELLLQDGIRRADFFKSLKNTVYFSLGVVPLQTIIALFLAVVVNQRRLRFKDFFRTSYYLPAITSSIAISMLFLFFYQKNGLINQVLEVLTFGRWEPIAWMSEPQGLFHIILGWFGITLRTGPEWLQTEILSLTVWDWISGPSIALMAIMLMNTWTTIGTMMVIFIAALVRTCPRPSTRRPRWTAPTAGRPSARSPCPCCAPRSSSSSPWG